MIQRIRDLAGAELVSEVPEGWSAAIYNTERLCVVMVHPKHASVVLSEGADGVWSPSKLTVNRTTADL